MTKVKFTSPGVDERVINASDFKRNKVEDQGKVTWNKANDFTAEVSESAAEFLVGLNGFETVTEEAPSTDPTGDDMKSATTRAPKG